MKIARFWPLPLLVCLPACASDNGSGVAMMDGGTGDAGRVDAGSDASAGHVSIDARDDDSMMFTSEQCRWQGYGIGAPPSVQCQNQVHLLAHVAETCFSAGGTGDAADFRYLPGRCTTGFDEGQVLCCFPDGLSMAADTAVSDILRLDGRASRPGVVASRDDLIADAQAACAAKGTALSEWSVLYGPDGVSALLLRFACR